MPGPEGATAGVVMVAEVRMTVSANSTLRELQADFRNGSTLSMPIAGMIVWAVIGITALWLDDVAIAYMALYVMAGILPLAFILDLIQGKNLFSGGTENPLTKLFLISIVPIALTVPMIVSAAQTGDPVILVLGMAILAGVIWIPYGWAADDPIGLRHAVGRGLGCYAAYWFAPDTYAASAICAVVVAAYVYSLIFMRRT